MSGGASPSGRSSRWSGLLWTIPCAALALLLFAGLAHPLFWADEAETAMFGRRIIEFGYPKVHGEPKRRLPVRLQHRARGR